MVQGVWLRFGLGVRVGCGTGGLVYWVGNEGRVGRDWGMVGLGYGWVGVRVGLLRDGVGQEGRDWGWGYGWTGLCMGVLGGNG